MLSFDLLFGGYWLKVNVEDYVYKDGDLCYVCIDDSGDFTWILGDAVMRGYYSIHDLTNMQMGFYSIDEAVKPVPTKALTTPTEVMPEAEWRIWGFKGWFFILMVILITLLVTLGIALIFVFCVSDLMTRADKEQKNSEE